MRHQLEARTVGRTTTRLVVGLMLAVAAFSIAPTAGADQRPASRRPDDAALPVARREVPLPAGVTRVDDCQWTRDGEGLLCKMRVEGAGLQVGYLRPDGSGYRCLTCGTGLTKQPQAIQALDATRFTFSIQADSETGTKRVPRIGECAPSLADCAALVIEEVTMPTIEGSFNERSLEFSPDTRHLAWTVVRTDGFLMVLGDVVPTTDGYEVTNVRVLNPVATPRSADDWVTRAGWYEVKTWHGNDEIVYGGTGAGGFNIDVYSLDLRTGRSTRLTTNPEWDEDGQLDPTGRYLLTSSTRRVYNQLRTGALAGYPGFLDAARVVTSGGNRGSQAARDHTVASARWLTTQRTERAGGDGIMLNAYECRCWNAGGESTRWNPKANSVVQTESQRGAPWTASRIMILTFPTLRERRPDCLDPNAHACRTRTPRWAPLITDYPILPAGTYEIRGPRGGSATYTYGGSLVAASRVDFAGYKARDGRIFDGFMELTAATPVTRPSYTIDLAVSGRHTGTHTTSAGGAAGPCGQSDTTLDGVRLHQNIGQWVPACGFPPVETCPSGADADATPTGDCSEDQWPPSFAPPEVT